MGRLVRKEFWVMRLGRVVWECESLDAAKARAKDVEGDMVLRVVELWVLE